MLDEQGRIVIPSEQLGRVNQKIIGKKLKIYFDSKNRSLSLNLYDLDYGLAGYENMYYIATHTINEEGRICIPKVIREVFQNANYLPVEKEGELYILII